MLKDKDQRILDELRRDAGQNVTSISKKLLIPRATVQERIKRMEREGIIKKFTAVVDYAKLGKPITVFVFVSFLPGADADQRELAQEIAQIEGIYEVYLISGEWDILLKVRGESMEEIGALVIDRLRGMKGVARTVTCTCFTTAKEDV